MKIFNVEQLYKADAVTTEKQGLDPTELMERAGTLIFQWLDKRMQGAQVPIRIFCGIGDNGGDGLVVGRLLIESGYNVTTYVVNCSDKRSKNFLTNYNRIKNASKDWPILLKGEDDFPEIHRDDVIIDAVFGIGLNRCAGGWVKKLLQFINASEAYILAVDIPSGLYANKVITDTEAIIKANHTITFHSPKLAFFLPETGIFTNTFEVLNIGIDLEYIETEQTVAEYIGKFEVLQFYKPRKKFSHKGDYGHSLLIGGSYGKIGAIVLASKASLNIGSGLTTAYVPSCGYTIMQTSFHEAMVLTDASEKIISSLEIDLDYSAVGIGMGMGQDKKTVSAFGLFLKACKIPIVIDADAINILASNKAMLKDIPENSILTPHLGELKRLLGTWKNDYDKIEKALKFSKKHKLVLLIKGAHSQVVFDGKIYINSTGNPGMATAGSGDVLSGIITGLIAQGYTSLEASIFGVYLHGSAGDIAIEYKGYQALVASDILDNLGSAYIKLFEQKISPSETEEDTKKI